MINNRIPKLSSNKMIFNSIKKDFNEGLTSSEHDRLKGCDKNDLNSDYK